MGRFHWRILPNGRVLLVEMDLMSRDRAHHFHVLHEEQIHLSHSQSRARNPRGISDLIRSVASSLLIPILNNSLASYRLRA